MNVKWNARQMLKWVGVLLLSFLPLVVYVLAIMLSLSQGEPYRCAQGYDNECWNYNFETTAANGFCSALQVVGGCLSILSGVAMLVWRVCHYKKTLRISGALERAILVFSIVALAVQLVYLISIFVNYLMDSASFWYLQLRHGYYFGGMRIYETLYRVFVYAAFSALIVSGLYFIIIVGMGDTHRFKDYIKGLKRILIALTPMLCCAVSHVIATAWGLPYNASCCEIRLPDPSNETVNWFVIWEVGGATVAFILSIILGYKAICSYNKNKGTSESVVDLFCVVLLVGEALTLLRLLVVIWNPEMWQDVYRAKYFGEEWDRVDLPTLIARADWFSLFLNFLRWAEWRIFAWLVLPVATVAGVLRGFHWLNGGNKQNGKKRGLKG